jgi:hypothetical protein
MRHLRRLLGQVTEPIKDLPKYSRNRLAQATQKIEWCAILAAGGANMPNRTSFPAVGDNSSVLDISN